MSEIHPLILDQLTLSQSQMQAVGARQSDVVVTAGAGTGKTRTLVARYLSLVAEGLPLRQIVAITFTRKAAREMRNRVRQEIQAYLHRPDLSPVDRRYWQQQNHALDAARIGTIHNFCMEILRAHPAEAGLDPRFGILDEALSELLREESITAALAWAADDADAVSLFSELSEWGLRQVIGQMMRRRLDTHDAFTVSCGSDMPEIIRENWSRLLAQRQQVLLAQLMSDPSWQAAVALLRQNQADGSEDRMEFQRRSLLAALNEAGEAPLLGEKLAQLAALDAINLTGGSAKAWPGGKPQLEAVKGALRDLRTLWQGQSVLQLALSPQDDLVARMLPQLRILYAYAESVYQNFKQERHVLDFDDLEMTALSLLQHDRAVRTHWQSVVKAMLVDEFQDTNQRQLALVRHICPKPGKLFIVGDAKQSIYRFRGADVTVFHREKEAIAAADGVTSDLDVSYRTHRALVRGLNDLVKPVLGEASPKVPLWVAPFAPLQHFYEEAAGGLEAPFIELHLTVGSKAEGALERAGRALAGRLLELVAQSEFNFGDIAILCRASTAFRAYEDALEAAGIPFLTVAGKGFYQRPEIRDLLNALQAIADPNDDLALAGLLRSPACGLSDDALYRLTRARQEGWSLWQTMNEDDQALGGDRRQWLRARSLIANLHRQAGRRSVADVLKLFLDETDYRAALRLSGLHRAARNAAKLLADAHESGLVSVGDFLEYVQGLRDSGSREGEARAAADEAVQIMSVHAAKGLEFPIVVIGDAGYHSNRRDSILLDGELGLLLDTRTADGQLPAMFQLGQSEARAREAAESDRLLYVAATRAEQKLLISGCAALHENSRHFYRLNGWLKQVGEAVGLAEVHLEQYVANGQRVWHWDLQVGQSPVKLSVYEPEYQPRQAPAVSTEGVPAPGILPPPWLAPLATEGLSPDPSLATALRVWQVVPTTRSSRAPAWIIGSLVHEALAAWRFPTDEFDPWVRTRAQAYGLSDSEQLDRAVNQTVVLLDRFRRHSLFQQIATADRRLHEIPYSLEKKGRIEPGIIDLLFLRQGQWTVVDFKTDWIDANEKVEMWLATRDYEAQLVRYGQAVTQLVGQTPRLVLCLLNFGGTIKLYPVSMAAA